MAQFKILNRLYWTPSKLYRANLKTDSKCWKCLNQGTLIHVFFECPRIKEFWLAVQDCIERVTGQNIPLDIRLFILGDPSPLKDITPSTHVEWIQTAIMLGRRLIVQLWKSAHIPLITEWHNLLDRTASYERVSFSMNGRIDQFHQKWDRFLLYNSNT